MMYLKFVFYLMLLCEKIFINIDGEKYISVERFEGF